MFRPVLMSTLAAATLMIAACSSSGERSGSEGTSQISSPYTDQIAEPMQSPTEQTDFDTAAAAERNLTTNLIYFDFDESAIKPDYQGVIDAYARYLAANPAAKVRLEGHTDERGTREYNIGLGERRSLSVESALLAKGASREQLSIISYGEERPAVNGHDESAWSQNRRVQIVRQ